MLHCYVLYTVFNQSQWEQQNFLSLSLMSPSIWPTTMFVVINWFQRAALDRKY